MRHLLFLLLAWGLAAAPAAAQAPSPTTPGAIATPDTAAVAVLDTAAAIHRLFVSKRSKGNLIAAFSLTGATVSFLAATQAYSLGEAAAALSATLLTFPVGIAALLYYRQYSNRHERRALEDFKVHRLSRQLQHQLKKRYFQPVHAGAGARR